jgi:hypothetical protein
MKKNKLIVLLLSITLILSLIHSKSAYAQAEGGNNRDKRQPPVQVLVQMLMTAITLKLIEPWVLSRN